MCSIAGIYLGRSYAMPAYKFVELNDIMAKVYDASTERGKDSWGYTRMYAQPTSPQCTTVSGHGKFESSLDSGIWVDARTRAVIVNFRAIPTTEDHNRTQPVMVERGPIVVHNGTIANDKAVLPSRYHKELDSFAIPYALSVSKTTEEAIKMLKGSMAFAALFQDNPGKMVLYRDYQPLHMVYLSEYDAYIFASRKAYLPDGVTIPLPPYSGYEFSNGEYEQFVIKPERKDSAVVCFSAGLDATVAASIACDKHDQVTLLYFRYGCRAEEKEWLAAEVIVEELRHWHPRCQIRLEAIVVDFLRNLGGSALTDPTRDISDGKSGAEFAHEWVPARNTVLTAIAASYCDRFEIPYIYLGLNLEEAGSYPDNTVEFVDKWNDLLDCGTQVRPQIITPLASMTKKDIVKKALEIKAPIHLSWSCYHGGDKHCGDCGSCYLRRTAFTMLGMEDRIDYGT